MKFFSLKREKTPNKQKNKKKTTKWYSKTYQYRNSIISSFPHERKWICPGISVTSCSNSPLHRQQISHNPLSKGVLWKHPFNWEECLQTSTHKAFWSENKKTLHCLAVVLWRGNFIVACIEERCRVFYKIPEMKKHFTHLCWALIIIMSLVKIPEYSLEEVL